MKPLAKVLAVAGVAGLGLQGVSAHAADYNWKLAHFAPKSSAFFTVMTQPVLDRVQEILGDEIEIRAFGGGELAPPFKVYEAVQDGIADMGHTTSLYVVNQDFANTFLGAHPGGMSADELIFWLYEAGGQDLLTEFKRETMGLHTLVASCVTSELWHSHKPLTTVEDLKGAKFRTSGAWATILKEKFDGSPVVVPGTEIYTMFERGGVDAIEWAGVSENMKMGFDEIAEYVTMPAPHVRGGCFELVWKTETWDALPDDVQDKLEAIAKLATIDALLAWKRDEIAALKELKANPDVKILEPSPELVAAVEKAGRDYVYELIEEQGDSGNGWLKKIADSYYETMDAYQGASVLFQH